MDLPTLILSILLSLVCIAHGCIGEKIRTSFIFSTAMLASIILEIVISSALPVVAEPWNWVVMIVLLAIFTTGSAKLFHAKYQIAQYASAGLGILALFFGLSRMLNTQTGADAGLRFVVLTLSLLAVHFFPSPGFDWQEQWKPSGPPGSLLYAHGKEDTALMGVSPAQTPHGD